MKATDEGIFLHRTAFSSSSLIVTYYTRQYGLRKFVFKGGKKKAHQLFPLSISELTYYGRPESDLLQLTSCDASVHTDFQFEPIKSTIAFFIAEAIRKSVHEFDVDQNMFIFLRQAVIDLDQRETELGLFPIVFLVELAEMLGMQPLVEGSARFFDLDEGTISDSAHPGHRSRSGEQVQIIVDAIHGGSLSASKATRENALQTLMEYYTIHVPMLKQLETFAIVKEILS